MVGEGLYRRTAHWIGDREPLINGKFNAALSLDANDGRNHSALIETLEKDVIPCWREASDRLATIQLSSNSDSERAPRDTAMNAPAPHSDAREGQQVYPRVYPTEILNTRK
jgi:hypothetical protein